MKAATFILLCNSLIIIMFAVACYLMSTVNPPALVVARNNMKKAVYDHKYMVTVYVEKPTEISISKEITTKAKDLTEVENRANLNATAKEFQDPMKKMKPFAANKEPEIDQTTPDSGLESGFTTQGKLNDIDDILKPQRTANLSMTNSVNSNTSNSEEIWIEEIETTNHPNISDSTVESVKGRRRSLNEKDLIGEDNEGSVVIQVIDDMANSKLQLKLSRYDLLNPRAIPSYRIKMKTEDDEKFLHSDNAVINIDTTDIKESYINNSVPEDYGKNISIDRQHYSNKTVHNFTKNYKSNLGFNQTANLAKITVRKETNETKLSKEKNKEKDSLSNATPVVVQWTPYGFVPQITKHFGELKINATEVSNSAGNENNAISHKEIATNHTSIIYDYISKSFNLLKDKSKELY